MSAEQFDADFEGDTGIWKEGVNVCVCVCGQACVCRCLDLTDLCLSAFFFSVVWSSAPSWMRVPHIRVLYAQHDVVVGARAGVLP